MPIRIHARDLPVRAGDAGVVFQLTYRVNGVSRSVPLADGETCIGRGAGCQLRLRAAGVEARHVRLRRDDETLFIQALGKAKVRLSGRPLSGLTKLPAGSEFSFGSVSAIVERVTAGDRHAAVRLQPLRTVAPDDDDSIDLTLQRFDALSDGWRAAIGSGITTDVALEILRECLGAVPSAVMTRRQPRAEWSLIAQSGEFDVAAEGAVQATAVSAKREVAVRADVSAAQRPIAQRICTQVALMLVAADHRVAPKRAAVEVPREEVWNEFVGSSVRATLKASEPVCAYANAILVLGETGTGKELAARALHRLWRRGGELVAINCAAIPAELLDAELFGVEAGAATGVSARSGRFEQARNGTLFLDEVSELPPKLQSKLLRILQEREYFPVGGTKLRRADVKIVAATNQTPAQLLDGGLRQDLYFRLAQATLTLAPLRERVDDLAALCQHFLTEFEEQFARGVAGLSMSALDCLKIYSWPGNVRELQNVLRGAYVSSPPGTLIRSAQLPPSIRNTAETSAAGTLHEVVLRVERDAITRELERSENVRSAARALGLSEGYLYRKMKKLGLHAKRPVS
jgi:DNA-binding NtrC family response regulator